MLSLQPAMGDASAGEVAQALAAGTRMHKAWVHAAKKPVKGSHRTVTCRVASGHAHIAYERGFLRGRKSSVLQRRGPPPHHFSPLPTSPCHMAPTPPLAMNSSVCEACFLL